MNLVALFTKNMEPHGISHIYDGDWTDHEKGTIDVLMEKWCEKYMAPGFNTWHLWKADSGSYFAKRFTWDNFDINANDFRALVDELVDYYGEY